jgi:cell division protein FtsI (penicillin-binding protein 3)
VYATRPDIHDGFQSDEIYLAELPLRSNITYYDDLNKLYNLLGYDTDNLTNGEIWAKPMNNGKAVQIEGVEPHTESIPDVSGMNARDAIYLLENLGIHTSLSGRGHVYWQSLNPGSELKKGDQIELRLRTL